MIIYSTLIHVMIQYIDHPDTAIRSAMESVVKFHHDGLNLLSCLWLLSILFYLDISLI